jgi:CubicO group peptidase (beta-lactamase class C family)
MKSYLHVSSKVLLLLLFIALTATHTSVLAQDKSTKIDELMKLYHGYGQFNGTVLVAENGQVIYKKGLGLANMEWNIQNEPDTKFRLGSITKQFTAAMILQLVEQGKIKLDGKISDYLPDYRKDVGDKITIHQLLKSLTCHFSQASGVTWQAGKTSSRSGSSALAPTLGGLEPDDGRVGDERA